MFDQDFDNYDMLTIMASKFDEAIKTNPSPFEETT